MREVEGLEPKPELSGDTETGVFRHYCNQCQQEMTASVDEVEVFIMLCLYCHLEVGVGLH